MAKNHHFGPSQVPLVKELVVALSKRGNSTKECLHFGCKSNYFSSYGKKISQFLFLGLSKSFEENQTLKGNNSFTHDPELNSQNRNMPYQQFHQMQNLGMTMEHPKSLESSNK